MRCLLPRPVTDLCSHLVAQPVCAPKRAESVVPGGCWHLAARLRERALTRCRSNENSARECQASWLSTQSTRCAYSVRTGLSPKAAFCCSLLQPRVPRFAARFSLAQFVSASRAGLLIPRSQVRSLPGPFDLQGKRGRRGHNTLLCAYEMRTDCFLSPLPIAVSCGSLQLMPGDRKSHASGRLRPPRRALRARLPGSASPYY